MQLLLFCFLCPFGLQKMTTADSIFDAKVRLEKMILKNYTKEARPVLNVRDNVTITVGISLYLIRNMDDKYQMLTTSLWIRQVWYDHRLTWTPSKFSSVKKINIPAKKVWTPDIKVYNEVNRGQYSGLDQFQTRIIVNHNGKVQWMGPTVMRTSCQVDIRMFPYDTQICRIKIGSWTYDGFALDVQPESYTMDISKSPSNLEWQVVSTSVQRQIQTYSCCPEPYPDVTYTISIKRRQQSYAVNFMFPAVLLTALTVMAFVTSQERIGLVLTCLVSMFFFLKMVAERTPSSDTVPLLSIYYVILCLEVTLIFYAVCITLNAYHRNPAFISMQAGFRWFVVKKLGHFWGNDSITDEIRQKLESLQAISNLAKSRYGSREELRTIFCCVDVDNSKLNDEQLREIESTNSVEESKFGVNKFKKENNHIRSTDGFVSVSEDFKGDYSSTFQSEIHHKKDTNKAGTIIEDEPCDKERSTFLDESDGLSRQSSCTPQHFQVLKPFHYEKCESCKKAPVKSSCSSFLNEMITLNQRLIVDIQEINYLVRKWNHKSSQKEHWFMTAAILDKSFFILFVIMFVVLTLTNFFW